MNDRVNEINTTLDSLTGIELIKPFEQGKFDAEGKISVYVEELEEALTFDVSISPQYPFKSHDSETIKFSNENLLEYKHIMGNGSICIHTAHSPVLSTKLGYDIDSVKAWIKKYYVNQDTDEHYEHLIVPQKTFKESHFAYFFIEVDYEFNKNQFGFVEYSKIGSGILNRDKIDSNIIQRFKGIDNKELVGINWNFQLKSLPIHVGLFIFLKDAPSNNQRWVFAQWKDFEQVLPQSFLKFLYIVEKDHQKYKGKSLPLLVGYNISMTEIHWQVIMLEIGDFPIYGQKENQQWLTMIDGNKTINWAMTKNCSYKYFFGRGVLNEKLTNGKILIIGIGAIGSIVAKTLVRSGCKKVDFIDYDHKEPENVCRAEYSFFSGISNKTNDLINEMCLISPFFEPRHGGYEFSEAFDFYLKSHLKDKTIKKELEKRLNEYDVIFDCSADNDLLFILSQLKINPKHFSLSISNHAKQLVCGAEQNRY
ncbi:MAG: ThiF family adenylyltransferase, partial [Algoriphagus sp.]